MRKALVMLATILISGCAYQTPTPPAKVGNGSSFETAIIIEAKTEDTGIAKEYEYLRAKACGENGYAEVLLQQLLNDKDHVYDKLQVRCADDSKEAYYFNIDSFFGKM